MKKQTKAEKRENEKHVVGQMIALYCHKNHHTKKELCPVCAELLAYAQHRIDKCPFMETKTFCSNCRVHCYQKEYRERIRTVMRFSGPRMLFIHPVMAVRHVILTIREKKKLQKEEQQHAERRSSAD